MPKTLMPSRTNDDAAAEITALAAGAGPPEKSIATRLIEDFVSFDMFKLLWPHRGIEGDCPLAFS